MRSVLVVVAVLVCVSAAFVGCSHFKAKTAGQPLDDTVITSNIKAKILKDPDLKTFAIDVSSYQGNVALGGRVPNRAAEQRLMQYAQDTKGVRSVRANLQIASYSGETLTSTATSRPMAAPGPGSSGTGKSTTEQPRKNTTTESTTETIR
ncbi:MAG: BON domain-containing protein [Syntrophorhabdales bacterium]|jgi:hypothetical protein